MKELNELLKELLERANDQVGVDDFTFRTEMIACGPRIKELLQKVYEE